VQRIAWGVSTAAYQIEGGWNESGRTPSVWDVWSQTPGRVYKSQTGNTATDHFHRWPHDVQLMASLGVKHYRYVRGQPRASWLGSKAASLAPCAVPTICAPPASLRLSLSWNRIVPGGFKGSPVNPVGLTFYKNLLQALR
jgi:beta-glucosidase/6-phospho-beta-glucosidase/beta-galactosidase